MVKKIRFRELRTTRHRRGPSHHAFLFEPLDAALLGAAVAAVLLLQLLAQTS